MESPEVNNSIFYKLRHFKNPKLQKSMRIFNINNPRSRVPYLDHHTLYCILDKKIKGKSGEYSFMKEIGNEFKNALIFENEDPNTFESILIMEEQTIKNNKLIGTGWINGCLYKNDNYYFRSASTIKNISQYLTSSGIKSKELKNSCFDGWFIDNATMSADHMFWIELKNRICSYP